MWLAEFVHSPLKVLLLLSKWRQSCSGLFIRWICDINPMDSGNSPASVSGLAQKVIRDLRNSKTSVVLGFQTSKLIFNGYFELRKKKYTALFSWINNYKHKHGIYEENIHRLFNRMRICCFLMCVMYFLMYRISGSADNIFFPLRSRLERFSKCKRLKSDAAKRWI